MGQLRTVGQLKAAVDEVFADIGDSCKVCTDPDCQGYLWVLESEEPDLLSAGMQLVQLNAPHGPTYLDTFPRAADGGVVIGRRGQRCPYLTEAGRCKVHRDRPLVCHLYPLSIEPTGDGLMWALHNDCAYVRRATSSGRLEQLTAALRQIIEAIAEPLSDQLSDTLGRVASVSKPTDADCFTVLAPLAPAAPSPDLGVPS